MRKITEPQTWAFTWGVRQFQLAIPAAYGFSKQFPLLQWHDTFDIALLHNSLKAALNATSGGPLNKFAVGNYQAQVTIKNMTNNEVTIDFYRWVVREDVPTAQAPQTQWGSSTSPINYANIDQQLYAGFTEQGMSGITANGWPIGMTAFNVSRYCSFVKIIKVKKAVLIMGGSFKKFVVNHKKWFIYNGSKVLGATGAQPSGMTMFGGKTGGVMCIATGGAIADTVNTNRISTSHVNLAIIAKEQYSFTGVNNVTKASAQVTDFGAIAIGQTINYATEVVGPEVVA